MDPSEFDQTVGTVAREAGITGQTLRLYIKLGLIEARKVSNGIAVCKRGAAAQARQIHAERLAKRGGNRRRA